MCLCIIFGSTRRFLHPLTWYLSPEAVIIGSTLDLIYTFMLFLSLKIFCNKEKEMRTSYIFKPANLLSNLLSYFLYYSSQTWNQYLPIQFVLSHILSLAAKSQRSLYLSCLKSSLLGKSSWNLLSVFHITIVSDVAKYPLLHKSVSIFFQTTKSFNLFFFKLSIPLQRHPIFTNAFQTLLVSAYYHNKIMLYILGVFTPPLSNSIIQFWFSSL